MGALATAPLTAAPAPAAPPPQQRTDEELLVEFKRLHAEMQDNNALLVKKLAGEAVKEAIGELIEKDAKLEAAVGAILAKVNAIGQRTSRPPGVLTPTGQPYLTLGQSFTESEAFKATNWAGRFKIQHTYNGRLEFRNTPPVPTPLAAPPPVTEGTSGLVIFPRRVAWVQPPEFPLVMRDLLDVIPLTGTNAVEYVTEHWTENPDYQVTEGTRKAQSGVSYTDATAMVRTIAHFIKVSRQMLADVPYVQTSIDQRMVYLVLRKEDLEVLYGDNSAGHLNGLMPQATHLAIPAGISALVTTFMDAVAAAITQIANNGYIATAIVMHPTDWAGLQLTKTTLGTYILQGPGYGPPQAISQKTLWGLPVVTSINMKVGEFLVGAFPGNAALFDREQAIVEISFENEDDFVNNLCTIRCEERVTLAVYVPLAFVWGNTTTPFVPAGAPLAANGSGHAAAPPAHGGKK
jgi:hypothetical protein